MLAPTKGIRPKYSTWRTEVLAAKTNGFAADEDNYIRSEGRELVANLAKAVGLPTMITTLRPDIDHKDDMVRNTTARTFSVVAGALGVPSLLPFLKAVCSSKKSWHARNTGCKIMPISVT